MRTIFATLASSLLFVASAVPSPEIPADARIVSASLFKNGLAVVTRSLTPKGPGTYRLDLAAEPVHGTFWIESDGRVEAVATEREFDAPAGTQSADLQQQFAGTQVVVHLHPPSGETIRGRVVRPVEEPPRERWNRSYEDRSRGWYPGLTDTRPARAANRFLVVETEKGKAWIDASSVSWIESADSLPRQKMKRPVLLLNVDGAKSGEDVTITYLTRGLAWAPSYRIDLSDPKSLSIRQQAVVRNELEDLSGAELRLISGFPAVAFASVGSPLSPKMNWSEFFQQIARQGDARRAGATAITQQLVTSNAAIGASDPPAPASLPGEGSDLHYESLGRRSLMEGDTLALETASARAPYERVVEWLVPDTRGADGRLLSEWERNQQSDNWDDTAWDAVRFANPFRFPMTTGPASFLSGDRFDGQQTATWASPGESTSVRINKALGVRTRHAEWEEPASRETLNLGGRNYRRAIAQGEISANNHRKQPISLLIRRRFSGELLSSEGSPEKKLSEEGIDSVNKRNELLWKLKVDPGGSKTLTYRYSVLVPN